MKKFISIFTLFLILSCISIFCFGQENQASIPKWVSDKGYWVVVSNIKTPENCVIYFYNNEKELLYKEKIEGIKINLKKRKVLMRLKNVLEKSLTAWGKQHLMKEDEMLVAIALKK